MMDVQDIFLIIVDLQGSTWKALLYHVHAEDLCKVLASLRILLVVCPIWFRLELVD